MYRYIILLLILITNLSSFWVSANKSHDQLLKRMRLIDEEAYELAIKDQNHNQEIVEKYLSELARFNKEKNNLLKGVKNNNPETIKQALQIVGTLEEGLLANPVLDFDKIILLRRNLGTKARSAISGSLGIAPANFNNNSSIAHPAKGWNNEISVLSELRKNRKIETLYRAKKGMVINDLCLNYNGNELMYSSIGSNDRWHLFSLNTKTGKTIQLTPEDITNFDCFDGCFLPDGRIIFHTR